MLPTNPPQSEPNIWMQIEKRIAELLDGGPAPTDVEDVRLPEYGALLDEGRRILHIHFEYLAKAEGERLLTDEHQEMLGAIIARDTDHAEALAHAHTGQFRDRFFRFMRLNFAEKLTLMPSIGESETSGFGTERDETEA